MTTQLPTQRAVIAGVATQIAAQLAHLPAADDTQWRSDAQRAYAGKLDDLDELLRTAFGALQHAVAALDSEIAAARTGIGQ